MLTIIDDNKSDLILFSFKVNFIQKELSQKILPQNSDVKNIINKN